MIEVEVKVSESEIDNSVTEGIFNISGYNLSIIETEVLEKGLSFCSTLKPNLFELFVDLSQILQKLKGHFFYKKLGNKIDK